MEKKFKYPGTLISDLSGVFALKDSNAPGYLSAPKLIALFNGLGFADTYKFPGIGIVTPDVEGLSRTQYALKRLTDINNDFRLPEALTAFLKVTKEITEVKDKLTGIFQHYNMPNPVLQVQQVNVIQTVKSATIARPKLGVTREPNLQTVTPIVNSVSTQQSTQNAESTRNGDPVFDEIPSGVKVVFMSYSWDDDNHKDWVLRLANDLAPYGLYVLLDQYLPGGYPLTHFMDKGLDVADRVIIVGTPKYKNKSIKSLSGGVTYEESIIHVDLMRNVATTKFLPIVRSGTFDNALPPLISNRIGFDFGDDSKYNNLVKELARELYDVPKNPRPKLGAVPIFEYQDLSAKEREELKRPESDFRKKQDIKWIERLLGNFSFDLMHEYLSNEPRWVDERVFISIDIWDSIIRNPTFRIYDPTLRRIIKDFHNLWHEIELAGLNFYSSEPGTHKVRFHGIAHDDFVSPESEHAFNKIMELQIQMQPLLKEFASYIQDYFEIDVEETSAAFIESLSH